MKKRCEKDEGLIYAIQKGDTYAEISQKGAELVSFKVNGRQLLWCGDPAYWERRAPILFPIVGGRKDDCYRYREKLYPMQRHGFAKDVLFQVVSSKADAIELELQDTEQTRKSYPFAFSLKVRYQILPGGLTMQITVGNRGEEPMPFSLGLHPGFDLERDGGMNRYHLEFGGQGGLYARLIEPHGFITDRYFKVSDNRNIFPDVELFKTDALIFDGNLSPVRLISDGGHIIEVSFEGLNTTAIWSAVNCDKFLCVEPWTSLGGMEKEYPIETRPDFITLAPHEDKEFRCAIRTGGNHL